MKIKQLKIISTLIDTHVKLYDLTNPLVPICDSLKVAIQFLLEDKVDGCEAVLKEITRKKLALKEEQTLHRLLTDLCEVAKVNTKEKYLNIFRRTRFLITSIRRCFYRGTLE